MGVLDMPDGDDAVAYSVFSHCFTCTKNIRSTTHISRALTGEGIGVLRFDFTGLGESSGDFSDTNFTTNIEDLASAAAFLEEHYQAPKLLIGHSLGGTAAIVAAHNIPSCLAVVTIATPFDPEHIVHHFGAKRQEIEEKGEATVPIVGRPYLFKRQYIEDVLGWDMATKISTLKKALLVFHGPHDDTVELENAGKIFDVAKHPKSFISLDDADHLLTDVRDASYVGSVIAAWVHRYVVDCDE